jgi:hypothetical protein
LSFLQILKNARVRGMGFPGQVRQEGNANAQLLEAGQASPGYRSEIYGTSLLQAMRAGIRRSLFPPALFGRMQGQGQAHRRQARKPEAS